MLEMIGRGESLRGFTVADKIVGKAAALLFAILQPDALHARELVQTRREINALRAQSEAQLRALRQQEARQAAGAIADIAAAVSEKLSGKQADAALHARYVEEWLSESDDHPWQA